MKKFWLLLAGGIAAIVLVSNLPALIALAISLVIMYYAYKGFMKTDSTAKKVMWVAVGLIALAVSVSSIPAILGIAAAYVLYLVYKNWNKKEVVVAEESNDPFTNFEKQWAELKKNY